MYFSLSNFVVPTDCPVFNQWRFSHREMLIEIRIMGFIITYLVITLFNWIAVLHSPRNLLHFQLVAIETMPAWGLTSALHS